MWKTCGSIRLMYRSHFSRLAAPIEALIVIRSPLLQLTTIHFGSRHTPRKQSLAFPGRALRRLAVSNCAVELIDYYGRGCSSDDNPEHLLCLHAFRLKLSSRVEKASYPG
jgi:hypothetical protein